MTLKSSIYQWYIPEGRVNSENFNSNYDCNCNSRMAMGFYSPNLPSESKAIEKGGELVNCPKCHIEIEHLEVTRTTSAKAVPVDGDCVFEDEQIEQEYYSCPRCKRILLSLNDRDEEGNPFTISLTERVLNLFSTLKRLQG